MAAAGTGDRPPLPLEIREARVRSGLSLDACAKAAGYKTKMSWYKAELGAPMPAWRWQQALDFIGRGDVAPTGRILKIKGKREAGERLNPFAFMREDQLAPIGAAARELRTALRVSIREMTGCGGLGTKTVLAIEAGEPSQHRNRRQLARVASVLLERRAEMVAAAERLQQLAEVTPDAMKEIREALRVTQHEVGAWAGLTAQRKAVMVSAWEAGTYALRKDVIESFRRGCLERIRKVDSVAAWRVLHDAVKTGDRSIDCTCSNDILW